MLVACAQVTLGAFGLAANAQPAASESAATLRAPGPTLTLDEAIARALRANPDLAAVRREVQAAAALREQAALLPNPSAAWDVEDVRKGLRTSSLVVSQPFELGGKRAARIRAAEQASSAAEADVRLRIAELRAAVIQFYYDVVAAQERERLAAASVELARRALDAAAKRVQAGRVSPVEQTRARVAESAARAELDQAQADLGNAAKRLAALLGELTPGFAVVSANVNALALPAPPADAAVRLAHAPELVRARAEVERREAVAALARTARTPNLVVSAGNVSIPEANVRATVAGVAIALPIFDRNQGNIREALVRTEQAREQLAAVELRLNSEVLQAQERLGTARRQAELARSETLPGARSALDAATLGFELGRFSFLDVLDAQRTLFAAQGQLVRAVAQTYQAAAELERLLGPSADAAGTPHQAP